MKRVASHCAMFLAGAIGASVIFAVHDAQVSREEVFGSLAHHTKVALRASVAPGCNRAAVAESVNDDLRVIFMRYDTITAEEQNLLRLIARHAAAGDLVVETEIARRLRAELAVG